MVTNTKQKIIDYFFILNGVIGSFITLLGITHTPSQPYFVTGSFLLLCTSFHFRLFFFMALEMILIAGHGAILLGIGAVLQIALPILLCLQLLFYYYFSGQLNNPILLLGISGIATLSIGLAYENQWIFFIGSTAIAGYAFYQAINNRPALIWAVLNALFATIALINIYFI